MNMKAEDVSTHTQGEASVDAVADLLIGEETEVTEDTKEEETLTEESTESEESDETETEETTLEEVATEEEPTWGAVLGIDEEKLNFDDNGNLTGVTVKVNGEVAQVGLNDLVSGYQLNKNVTQKSQALSEEKKQFDQQKEQAVQAFTAKLQEVQQLSTVIEKQLVSEFDGIDWEALRVQNPAEYAAARQDFAARAQEVQLIKETVGQELTQQQQQVSEIQQAQQTEYLKGQYEKMLENNPGWSDEKVYASDIDGMKSFCNEAYGFNDADFNLVRDARIIELIKDAKKFREGVKMATNKLNKPVPKFQKSGGKPVKKTSKLQKLTKAAKTAKGAQKRSIQSDAVAELLLGNE